MAQIPRGPRRLNTELNRALVGVTGGATRLQTPALVIDLVRFKNNLETMSTHCQTVGVALRPHTKTHKCAAIAKLQIEAGARGICCAKLGEAEAMQTAGIQDILLTSPVVTPSGIDRLLNLNESDTDIFAVVDNPVSGTALNDAARKFSTPLKVLLDLDPGLHRTGMEPGPDALKLAQQLSESAYLDFTGLQMYAGNLMHITLYNERKEQSVAVMETLVHFRNELQQVGIACPVTSGGGTGTFDIDPETGALDELQAGSYPFMDRQYNEIETRLGHHPAFFTSLFVQTTVVSANHDNLITTDAGLKAFATDDKTPELQEGGPQDGRYFFFGDEHGGVRWRTTEVFAVGDWMRVITPHCDPTFNLYDVVHVIEGDTLVDIWPIDARGRSA